MRSTFIPVLMVVFLALTSTACEAIGLVFEAGIWVGVLMVVLILAVVGFIASKIRR